MSYFHRYDACFPDEMGRRLTFSIGNEPSILREFRASGDKQTSLQMSPFSLTAFYVPPLQVIAACAVLVIQHERLATRSHWIDSNKFCLLCIQIEVPCGLWLRQNRRVRIPFVHPSTARDQCCRWPLAIYIDRARPGYYSWTSRSVLVPGSGVAYIRTIFRQV